MAERRIGLEAGTRCGRNELPRAMSNLDHSLSPELVLVAPPELAALARAALPDYAHDYEVARVRAAYAAAAATATVTVANGVRDRRFSRGSVTFTMVVALNCVAPFVLL